MLLINKKNDINEIQDINFEYTNDANTNKKNDINEIQDINFEYTNDANTNNIKNYFKLSTLKITILSAILAFEILLVIIGHYLLGLMPIYGFLVFEINFIAYFICYRILNCFYTFILLIVSSLFRFILGDNFIQIFAIFCFDFCMLFAFMVFAFIFLFSNSKYENNNWKQKRIIQFKFWFACIPSIIFVAICAILLNNLIFYHLWGVDEIIWNTKWILIVFIFNITKYFFNCFIYSLIDVYVAFHIKNLTKKGN